MSGIAGILERDGGHPDRALLRAMSESLRFRGPDAEHIWTGERAGLAHTLLRGSCESQDEQQPFSFDREVGITADARIDGRDELVAKLRAAGRDACLQRPDVELILHAYHVWGERCVEHLLGDFAFAIWDGHARRLFCARDHFGVRPFFYAEAGGALVFSNTIAAVRQHPGLSNELNDLAVADFLLFGCNQEPATTLFRDIMRLPPGCVLIADKQRLEVRRYWTLPDYPEVRHRRAQDYVEHFREVFGAAVRDRTRCRAVATFLSGGLDSPTIAALAAADLRGRGGALKAFHTGYERLIPDHEREFTVMVADALGIDVECIGADDIGLFEWRAGEAAAPPEPSDCPVPGVQQELLACAARHSRVVLSGHAGDSALMPSLIEVRRRLFGPKLPVTLGAIAAYVMNERRLPRVGLRTRIRLLRGDARFQAAYPEWIEPALERRLDLRARWAEKTQLSWLPQYRRPEACSHFASPYWGYMFETVFDGGASGFPVEVAHPFIDLRVAAFLLGLSSIPWCLDKQLLRRNACGILPERIRLRPKSPLAGYPVCEFLRKRTHEWVDGFRAAESFSCYVVRDRIPKLVGSFCGLNDASLNLRPLALNFWLEGVRHRILETAQ